MARYGMVIDLKRCIACHACTIACKTMNGLPDGVRYTNVITNEGDYMDVAQGTYPSDLRRVFHPVGCQHCSEPACVAICPTGATYKDEETGIVMQDTDTCIGCQSCLSACPYTDLGVRTYVEEPQFCLDFAFGDWDAPHHNPKTVEKCNFCYKRLARGERPACMESCAAGARHFGDLDDPASEVSQLLANREYERLREDGGTEPNVYYLV